MKGRDVQRSGIATHFCESAKIPDVEQELLELPTPNEDNVKAILDSYHGKCKMGDDKPFALQVHLTRVLD